MKSFIKYIILFIFVFSFFYGKSQITINSIDTTRVQVCNGDASGTITINATGTYPPLTYSIDNGTTFQASNVFNGLYAGTYVVVVKDSYGNVLNDIAIIKEPAKINITGEDQTNVTGCFGNTNGNITITASGGVGTLDYSIDNGTTFQASNIFNSIAAGTYNVNVQDDNGCIIIGSEIIITQPNEVIMTAGANNILGCHGDQNGSIEINASGGTSPLKYSIDNGANWQSSDYFSSLGPGSYHAIVKDAVECFSSDTILNVTEPDQVVISSETPEDVTTCNGEATGKITIVATGGTGHLFYAISGIFQEDDGVFPNLSAGTYNVEVKDVNQCLVTGSTLTINQPPKILIDSIAKTDITTCHGDTTGSIIIYAHGGIAPIEYSVDNGANWQFSNSFTLPQGTYNTLVRDANHCIATGQSLFIDEPTELLITNVNTTDVTTCFGGDDGTIHIVTNGGGTGIGTYNFSIDDGATYFSEFNLENLSASTFDLIVVDAHNCRDTFENITIGQPTQVVINDAATILTDPLCYNGTDGSIQVFASGGTGELYYSSDGGTIFTNGNILAGLSANIAYNIAVKDDHECLAIGSSYTLGQPNELVIDDIISQNVDDCFGGNNGSIVINASGGTPNIEYSINSGQDYQLSNTFTSLPASSNFIIIKDSHNCETSGGTITISQPDPIQVTYQNSVNILGCKSDEIGEIHFDVDGGTLPYTYSISGPQNISNNTGDFLNLGAGTYSISVKDDNNCPATGNDIYILEPDTLIVSVINYQNIDCYGNTNGNISLNATGGEFRWYYSIDGGANYQTSPFFSNLSAGDYPIYVKDSYNCVRSGIVQTISQPSDFVINSVNFENINDCFGDDDGTITINASGGTPNYLYSINLGGTWQNNNGVYTNLSPGKYLIKVRDANFCEKTFLDINLNIDTITLTEPPLLKVDSINTSSIKCYGDDNGIIDAYASGGTGAIKYSIDNGATYPNADDNGHFEPLLADTYNVKMKDVNGCETNSYAILIYEPDTLYISNVTSEDEQCLGAEDGVITIYGIGGTLPYEYSVDGINYQTNRRINDLAAGTYTPMLLDANACAVSANPVIIGSPENQSLFSTDVSEGCSPLSVQFSRLNDGITYLWEFGDSETSNYNEPLHVFYNLTDATIDYTVTAYSISPTGCKDTTEMIITVHPQPNLSFNVDEYVTYYPETTRIITNTSPTGYLNYLWNFGDGQTSTNANPGSHNYETCGEYEISVYAKNVFACSDTAYKTIKIITHSPEARFSVDTTEHCVPYTFNFENQSFYADTFEWVLDDGTILYENNISQYFEDDGTYNIKLNVYGFCNTKDSLEQIITVHQTPIVNFEVLPDTVMLPDQPIHCYNRSSADAETFFWEFGDGGTSTLENPSYQYTTEGTYEIQLTVVSENKCIDSLMLNSEVIVLPAGILVFPTAFSPNGNGENDVFKPTIYNSVEIFKMEIFNRWGEQVFYTEDIKTGWTGFYNGLSSMQDVYVWRAEGKFLNGTPFEMSGSVTLLK